jgi:site-specific recombinase XerD
MAKSHLKLVTPTEVNRTVAPTRRPNAELRTREHLTPSEVEAVIEAAKANRHGHRDATMILVTFRHGLRAAEVCGLRWDQARCSMCGGSRTGSRARTRWSATRCGPCAGSSGRASRRPSSSSASAVPRSRLARMIERAAAGAGLELKAHPHMLRHACGYALANKGHDTRAIQGWLGHRSITSTAVYTALAPNRFKDFWRD